LPAYYTVELGHGGRVYADGRQLASLDELSRDAARAVAARSFVGAAVFGDLDGDRARLLGALEQLRGVGFAPVRAVGRVAPREIRVGAGPPPVSVEPSAASEGAEDTGAAGAEATASSPAVEPPSVEPVPDEPDAAIDDAGPDVELKTVGLHIGGAPNDEPRRQRLVRQFETRFDELRRCYPLASDRSQNASFGVDILVPARGGKGRLGQTRSRLTGRKFRSCMNRVFRDMRFAAPPNNPSATISYSLNFKPRGGSAR
jgi:hypothetical protein